MTNAKIRELVNPKETALQIYLGSADYNKLKRRALKEGQHSPYAYWREHGGFTYKV